MDPVRPATRTIATNLRLEIWPNGNGGTILFYPGSMMGPGHYYVFLSALVSAGFTVAALHLKGHGQQLTFPGRFCNFTFQELLAQGLTAECWLLENGFGPVAVCGHSQGGILTLAHAARSQTIKAAFALGAIFPQTDEAIYLTRFRHFKTWRKGIIRLLENGARFLPFLPIPLPLYLELSRVTSGKIRPIVIGKEKSRLCYPLHYLVSLFTTEIPHDINCPFCLFNARDDALFTMPLIEKTFAAIHAPAKELIWIPTGGHMAPFNPNIAAFIARSMASFCSGLGVPLILSSKGEQCIVA